MNLIAQTKHKRSFSVAIETARRRRRRMPDSLLPPDLSGPAGGSGVVDIIDETSGMTENESSSSESSSSGVSPLLYFFIVWVVLILLVVALVPLLVTRKRRARQQQLPSAADGVEELVNEHNEKTEASTQLAILTILMTGTAIGLALSIFAILSCDFLSLSEPITMDLIWTEGDGNISVEVYSLGLWAVGLSSRAGFLSGDADQDACFRVSGFLGLDWQFKLARASAVIASLLGGLSLPILLGSCASANSRWILRFLFWPFWMAIIFQFLTLILLGTTHCVKGNCWISIGALASISAALYWLFCAVAASYSFPKNIASSSG
jgi:hypothetical protein